MPRTIYSPKDIYEQEFKVTMRGFDRSEVDEFLDNVINDYELLLAEIQTLTAENARLKAELQAASSGQTNRPPVAPAYGGGLMTPKTDVGFDGYGTENRGSSAATNVDILKRISRLEKEVFGKQLTE